MKRGRDGDRVAGPLFPRLHVHDADDGGPRAPPRNKMALYELFSIPSQRFNSDAVQKQHQAGSLVPSAFLSQGHRHEKSVSSSFCERRTPVDVTEKVHPRSVEGINQNAMSISLERKSLKHGSQKMANTAGNVQMNVECSSLHPDDLSSVKGLFGKKPGDEDDFTVPTCVPPGIALQSDKDHQSMDIERTRHSHLNSVQKNAATAFSLQSQVQSSHGKSLERHGSNSLTRGQCESSGEGKAKDTVSLHRSKVNFLSHPAIREKAADPLNIHKSSSNQEHPSCKLNECNSSQGGSASRCQKSNGTSGETRCRNDAELIEKQVVISNGRSESCSRMSLDKSLLESPLAAHCNIASEKVSSAEAARRTGSPEDADKINPSEVANKSGSLDNANGNDDISETSMVDSIPGVDICPDDIVGLIGPKHFWKARRAIVNQQRAFAAQVFELHRLIKVQKLIAASPHLLLEDASYLHSSSKASVKDPPPSFLVKSQLQIKQRDESHKVNNDECSTENTESANFSVNPPVQNVKQKGESHRAICNSEYCTENTGGNLPLPHEHVKGPIGQLPRDGKVSSLCATSDSRSGAWCFQPPGNQWLIPVMSPSEGLIYKPYTGPCPPSAAFLAPVYSGCGPVSVPPVSGDLMRPAFGVPVSHQQQSMGVIPVAPAVAPNYFPAPYGLPVVNPLVSSSLADQVRQVAGPQPSGQLELHSWSSCNMANPIREAISERAHKVQTSEDCDKQGSTASCPGDRSRGRRDALPQFPMAACVECSGRPTTQAHSGDHHARVIRVVPHNARSATESAARIFRSIQKERQQHDSV